MLDKLHHLRKRDLKYIFLGITCVELIIYYSTSFRFPSLIQYAIWIIGLIIYALALLANNDKKFLISKKAIIFCILVLISLFSFYFTHDRELFYLILTCWLFKNDDLKIVIKFILKVSVITTVFVIIYYFISKYGLDKIYTISTRGETLRYSLGFIHPNSLGLIIFNEIMMYLYVEFHKNNGIKFIISFIFTYLMYLVTDSRTAFIASILCILLFLIAEIRVNTIKKIIKVIGYYIFPIMGIFFVVLVYLYGKENSLGLKINELLSGRLMLTKTGYDLFGTSLFGLSNSYIYSFFEDAYFYLDSLYAYLAIEFGFIWFFIFSILIYISLKKANIEDSIMITLLSIYSISERNGLSMVGICSLLVIKYYFSNVKEKNKIKNVKKV